jgi:N-acetylglucosamine kinase-like BadF-type ATPase
MCAGLAGVASGGDNEQVETVLRQLSQARRVLLFVDAFIGLVGGTEGRPGVITVSGTGSVAYGVDSEQTTYRTGGWGYLLGDEGSGYDIARRGLIAAFRAYDGRGAKTVLEPRIKELLALDDLKEVIPLLSTAPLTPRRVAGLYPMVVRAAEEGDKVACELIEQATHKLVEMAVVTYRKFKKEKARLFVAAGGVFERAIVFETFRKRLKSLIHEAEIIRPKHPPEYGAIIAAKAELEGRPAVRPFSRAASRR